MTQIWRIYADYCCFDFFICDYPFDLCYSCSENCKMPVLRYVKCDRLLLSPFNFCNTILTASPGQSHLFYCNLLICCLSLRQAHFDRLSASQCKCTLFFSLLLAQCAKRFFTYLPAKEEGIRCCLFQRGSRFLRFRFLWCIEWCV